MPRRFFVAHGENLSRFAGEIATQWRVRVPRHAHYLPSPAPHRRRRCPTARTTLVMPAKEGTPPHCAILVMPTKVGIHDFPDASSKVVDADLRRHDGWECRHEGVLLPARTGVAAGMTDGTVGTNGCRYRHERVLLPS
jgi:hypothetical protein